MTQLEQMASTAVLCGARVSGLLICSPVFGSAAITAPVKAVLALTFAVLVYPAYAAHAIAPGTGLLSAVASELLIGAVIGLGAQMVFEAVQLAGQTMGLQMGLSLATVFDPSSNADSPVMSTFVQMLAVLIFLALNAHVALLRAVAGSYQWLPPGTELRWAMVSEWGSRALAGALIAAVQLAGPVVLATICVDIVLGFIGKASPQIPVLLVGISIKAVVALVILFVALRFWPDLIGRQLEAAIGAAERLLHAMR